MKFDYPARVKLATGLLAIVLLAGDLRQLKDTVTFDFSFIGNDEISLYEKRFQSLRKALPASGVVSYVDDSPKGSRQEFKAYYLTQYALSPLLLLHPEFPVAFYSQEMLALKGKLLIANRHDTSREPYLVRLFPGRFEKASTRQAATDIFLNGDFRLLNEFGKGLSLYGSGSR